MKTIQVQQNGGLFSCDIGISKEEWLEILLDKELTDKFKDALLRFYYMPGHRGSCTAVSKKIGGNAQALNILVSKFGNRVQKRFADRFEILGTDGKHSRWIIPMNNGKILSNKEEGTFEWELRPELAEAIRDYLYLYLVEKYKELRRELPIRDKETQWDELYKWELITSCEGKEPFEVVANHLAHPKMSTLGGFANLIDAQRDNKALKYVLEQHPNEFKEMLNRLADESMPLNDRLIDFKQSMINLLPKTGFNSKANDERTVATILTCFYPDRYTFYKHDEVYDRLCKYLGEDMQKAGYCYAHFLSMLAPLTKIVATDSELQEMVIPMLEGQRKSNLLIAQDIIWMLLRSLPERLGFIYNILYKKEEMNTTNNLSRYIELLKNNKNLILTGAPGTGKTYMAKAMAKEIVAEVGFVQFHPSYDYTDFVEGLRPTKDGKGVGFERRDGVFKEFCKKALTLTAQCELYEGDKLVKRREIKNCVFIIDEINRGEISKIFGELFFSIDPGYRGEKGKVNTQYQNMIEDDDVFKDGFYVPENVYIIGTMNDIDRSVESMDFAMRRRFAWQEVTAEESYRNMIENEADFADVKDEIKARMFNLNKAIAETEGLNEAYQIGAAYFRKYLDYETEEKPFLCLWENHLKGLLFEYLRGNRKAKELLVKLHNAYNNTSIDEQPAHTNEG